MKVSLHASGRWRYAFNTQEQAEAAGLEASGDRVIHKWDSEETRIPGSPLRAGFAVVLGRFSLHYPPDGSKASGLSSAEWLKELPPAPNGAWQFMTIIADPGVQSTAPGTRAMGAAPVGTFTLRNGASVWVMRHLIMLEGEGWENIQRAIQSAVAALGPPTEASVYHSGLWGRDADGPPWVAEIAATANPDAPPHPD